MEWLKIDLPFKINAPVLAAGADIKNRICFAYGKSAFLSQKIDDLEILDNFEQFRIRLSSIRRHFGISPSIIAYDSHPEYFSRKYMLGLKAFSNARRMSIQHHHAHIAACMVENKLGNQKSIGVAFDGTGFGDDQTLWGAEFLAADYKGFKRAAHLRYVPLLGGKAAILQPWRLSAAWLYLALGKNFLDLDLDFIRGLDKKGWAVLGGMWEQNFNAPSVSSMGRLFDAAASLILGIYQVKFEAEAAIELERVAEGAAGKIKPYSFDIKKKGQVFMIDPVPAFRGIVRDLQEGRSKKEIAACFHMTAAGIIAKTCLRIRQATGLNTAILSGGVFQNKILFEASSDLLRKIGFRVISHKILPCSDECIGLGQAAAAFYAA